MKPCSSSKARLSLGLLAVFLLAHIFKRFGGPLMFGARERTARRIPVAPSELPPVHFSRGRGRMTTAQQSSELRLRSGPKIFDLDSAANLRAAVNSTAHECELVLLTSDINGIRAAVNMVLQLQRIEIEHQLLLMPSERDCELLHAKWAWLVCGWSAGLGLKGFTR